MNITKITSSRSVRQTENAVRGKILPPIKVAFLPLLLPINVNVIKF